MLACDGVLIATSENFGSLSGMTKDFLERVYYPCEDRVAGKAYSALAQCREIGATLAAGLATGLH
ncbi:MAG: hypothetical protein ABI624_19135 [Casimicrobiaceae bacterium]